MTADGQRQAIARGYLLICVFYVHALYGVFQSLGSDPDRAMLAGVQIKLLAPAVSAFFFLSGMSAPFFYRKGWLTALKPSLTLIMLAALGHVIAVLLDIAIHQQWFGIAWFARRMAKPILYGTGYENFISWFLVVLAFARIFAYAFMRSWRVFLPAAALAIAAVLATRAAGLPDNLYEWRNWPTASLFFLLGMRVPNGWRIPAWAGLLALPITLALAWLNRPGVLTQAPCLTCDLGFVAQPMIGQYGSLPIYVVQQLLFMLFLLWVSSWSVGKMPGKVGTYFGADSLSMLLMHGWVLVTLYPIAAQSLPPRESAFLYASILSVGIVVHALLYFYLQPALHWLSGISFKASSLVIDIAERLFAIGARPRPSTPVTHAAQGSDQP
ncbi:acyltransferase family protein [Sphingomonas turrisvirgatae]|uniref:Acyltransferase 3 domain-containing protein n=1 Tax=Sphingomonas turrisvirgatae TaxID=1888892 RepID=A0A1E3LRY0_9SPHN|nr:acyltransferase family protein [Sphingomonas turrisvirgatae]ODP36474.1 hypothetical protein BFL28_05660 [Sphingomonas turrisvirgatae]